jgi:hypothetical protein
MKPYMFIVSMDAYGAGSRSIKIKKIYCTETLLLLLYNWHQFHEQDEIYRQQKLL